MINKIKELFKGCGDVMICCIDANQGYYKLYRDSDLGCRMNWVKCKKIMDNQGFKYYDGTDGYTRCIGFWV